MQASPHPPQLPVVPRITSQPSCSLMLQLAVPEAQTSGGRVPSGVLRASGASWEASEPLERVSRAVAPSVALSGLSSVPSGPRRVASESCSGGASSGEVVASRRVASVTEASRGEALSGSSSAG